MENLINKFTNKYICLYNLFHVRRLESKDDYDFEGGGVEKLLRTTVQKCRHQMEKSFVRNIKRYSQRTVWSRAPSVWNVNQTHMKWRLEKLMKET